MSTTTQPKRPKPLTARQETFAQLVAGGMRAAWAYRRSGYSPQGASQQIATDSYRLRNAPHVAARILELQGALKAAPVETVNQPNP